MGWKGLSGPINAANGPGVFSRLHAVKNDLRNGFLSLQAFTTRFVIDRFQAHHPHQPAHALSVYLQAVLTQRRTIRRDP